MKRLKIFCLIAMLGIFGLCGCSNSDTEALQNEALQKQLEELQKQNEELNNRLDEMEQKTETEVTETSEATMTPAPTSTPEPTSEPTSTPVPTNTPTPLPTPTCTPKPTPTATPKPTKKPNPTATPTPTPVPVTKDEMTISFPEDLYNVGDETIAIPITVSTNGYKGEYSITYKITDDFGFFSCRWGEWDGNTIPLYVTGLESGCTTIKIGIKDTSIEEVISIYTYVPTLADMSSVTVDKVLGEYKHYSSGLAYNIYRIDKAEPKIKSYNFLDDIDIEVDILVTCIEYNYSTDYMKIPYELYNADNVCVKSGTLLIKWRYINQAYAEKLYFSSLEPGDYRLVFADYY